MPFDFKRFHVDDTNCGHKVGTDAVALGVTLKWINPTRENYKILDVGTGSGVLALMAAQLFPQAQITGVEIDPKACNDAMRNFAGSEYHGRLRVVNGDIIEIKEQLGKYNLVVSNPPFFNETLHSPYNARNEARHGKDFNVDSLLDLGAALLEKDGTLAFIAPMNREEEIDLKIECKRLKVVRKIYLKPSVAKKAYRIIYHLSFKPSGSGEVTEIAIGSEEYKEMTKEFYL